MKLIETIAGKDGDYEIYIEPKDHSMDFEVKSGAIQPNGSFFYSHECNDEDPRRSIILNGFIKWDGCSHLYLGEDENGYIHTDSIRSMAQDLSMLITKVADLAKETIVNGDKEMLSE